MEQQLTEEQRIANHLRSLNVRPQNAGFGELGKVNQHQSKLPEMQPGLLQSLFNYFSGQQAQPQQPQAPVNAFMNPGGLRQAQEAQIMGNKLPPIDAKALAAMQLRK